MSRRDVLRWQFDLTWSLLEYHVAELLPEQFLWEPARLCWTMHRDGDGGWAPDFAESEPDPVPVPTIGWLTWHMGWWWSAAIDHTRHQATREVSWPGPGRPTVDWLRGLRLEWIAVLGELSDSDLDVRAPFPWQDRSELTVAHMIG